MNLPELCVRRPVFTTMLILFPVVVGAISYMRMGTNLFPNVDLPIVTITTTAADPHNYALMLTAGIVPIALGQGPGSASRASMAEVIVGGQALSLLLSLLVRPLSYSLFDDFGIW